MLSHDEVALARELLAKMREVTAREPEFTRDGQPLADLLQVSRTTAWYVAHRADFIEACPPVKLGPKLTMRRTAQIRAWRDQQR
jgi:hypothetical protein